MRNWGRARGNHHFKICFTIDYNRCLGTNHNKHCTIGNRTEFTDKSYGPFKMEVPKLSKPDMYKFLMYTLLQNNFTVLSTETIAEIGATITTHNEQFFKDHKVGAQN